MLLHLVNLTGLSDNTYFDPLPVFDLEIKIRSAFKPAKVYSMLTEKALVYTWKMVFEGLKLDRLGQFEGIVIEK